MAKVRMAKRKLRIFGNKSAHSYYILVPRDLAETMAFNKHTSVTYYLDTEAPANQLIVEFSKTKMKEKNNG